MQRQMAAAEQNLKNEMNQRMSQSESKILDLLKDMQQKQSEFQQETLKNMRDPSLFPDNQAVMSSIKPRGIGTKRRRSLLDDSDSFDGTDEPDSQQHGLLSPDAKFCLKQLDRRLLGGKGVDVKQWLKTVDSTLKILNISDQESAVISQIRMTTDTQDDCKRNCKSSNSWSEIKQWIIGKFGIRANPEKFLRKIKEWKPSRDVSASSMIQNLIPFVFDQPPLYQKQGTGTFVTQKRSTDMGTFINMYLTSWKQQVI